MAEGIEELLSNLRKNVHAALRLWHKESAAGNPLRELYLVRKLEQEGLTVRQATNQALLQGLERLDAENPRHADLLRRRYLDETTMVRVANQRNTAESALYEEQRLAIDRLAHLLYEINHAELALRETTLEQRLPTPTATTIVGLEGSLAALGGVLTAEGPPWLIAIEGIGGIGKTTLADALVRRVMRLGDFGDVGWVSCQQTVFNLGGALSPVAQPTLTVEALVDALSIQLMGEGFAASAPSLEERLAALQRRLKGEPHLIVIDNLETFVDVEGLLPTLRRLMGPTRFLLTSRQSLYDQPDVYHFIVPELGEPDALQLVRQEAALRNLPELAKADTPVLRPVYDTVGGNPLALRLVVGQTHVYELPSILADLEAARGKAELLYAFIYRRAWDHLDEGARQVFLAMPLVTEGGGTIEELVALTGLDPYDVRQALAGLIVQNLVDARGWLDKRRYSIHNLTRAFLLEGVARWQ